MPPPHPSFYCARSDFPPNGLVARASPIRPRAESKMSEARESSVDYHVRYGEKTVLDARGSRQVPRSSALVRPVGLALIRVLRSLLGFAAIAPAVLGTLTMGLAARHHPRSALDELEVVVKIGVRASR